MVADVLPQSSWHAYILKDAIIEVNRRTQQKILE
jgi:hypothetical protein